MENIKSIKIDLVQFINTISIFILIFQGIIQQYFYFFKFYDELIALVIFFAAITIIIQRKKLRVYDMIVILNVIIFSSVGWISTAACEYQNFSISLMGFYVSIKWFVIFWGYKVIRQSKRFSKILNFNSAKLIRIVAVAYVLVYILGSAGIINGGVDSWDVTAKTVFLIAAIWGNREKTPREKRFNIITISLLLGLVAVIGNAKAYFIIAFTVLLLVVIIGLNYKIKIWDIVFCGIMAVMVAWEDIYFYYIEGAGSFARSVLLTTGIKIANDYFPFGTGWSTFASYFSGESYSLVYHLYGLDTHYEIGEQARRFLSDIYWGEIIAETGWIGAICILVFFALCFFKIQKLYYSDVHKYAGALLILSYMAVTTVEESGFSQPVTICLALLLSYFVSEESLIEHEKRR